MQDTGSELPSSGRTWRQSSRGVAAFLVGVGAGWLAWLCFPRNGGAFYAGLLIGAAIGWIGAIANSEIRRHVIWVVAGVGAAVVVRFASEGSVVTHISVPTTVICVVLAICISIVIGHGSGDRHRQEA